MPTITLSRKVLEDNVGKLKDEELKERISYLGTDLDSVDKEEVVVEVFPNRPDMLSEQGFSRALKSFIGKETGLREYDVKDGGEKVVVDKSVSKVRPYTACAIVKGLGLDKERIREIVNIQEKLHVTFGRDRKKVAIGLYPLDKIETPIHYKALKPDKIKFRPLEADEEMTGSEILEEHPKGKLYGHLLEGCSKYPVFVDSAGKFLSMPPVINSHDVGKVTENTRDIFIECSGHDLRVLKQALNILVTTFADMGGEVYSMEVEYRKDNVVTPDLSPEEMRIDVGYVNKVLGLGLGEKDVKELLEKMGYGYEEGKALVPAYRTDVLHMADLVEDIAIAYGYDNFSEEIPDVSTIGREDRGAKFAEHVRDVLVGHGLLEVMNYSLSNEEVQQEFMKSGIPVIKLANSLSEEYNCLRAWITPCLLKTLSENKHEEYPQNLFEIGTIFKESKDEDTRVEEAVRASVALCGEGGDYTRIKQVLDSIFEAFGIGGVRYEEVSNDSYIQGRAARVYVNDKGVAYIGEISPEVLENFDLEMPVSSFELNLTDLREVTEIA